MTMLEPMWQDAIATDSTAGVRSSAATGNQLTERQAQFLALFDGTRTHEQVADEARVTLKAAQNAFCRLRGLGYQPLARSAYAARREQISRKMVCDDGRIMRVLAMFWHRSRQCYVPHTAEALDERAGADVDLRSVMCRRGLLRGLPGVKEVCAYEITDAGRAWLEAQG